MPHSTDESESTGEDGSRVTMMDPRAARFGQTITMTVLLVAIVLQAPILVLIIAVLLNAAVLSGWRLTVYGFFWRYGMTRIVGKPEEVEPAAPHRFAKLMGASMSAIATLILFGAPAVHLPELAPLGYGVALVHAGAAGIGGVGNYCIGCRMYKQVAFFRRLGVV